MGASEAVAARRVMTAAAKKVATIGQWMAHVRGRAEALAAARVALAEAVLAEDAALRRLDATIAEENARAILVMRSYKNNVRRSSGSDGTPASRSASEAQHPNEVVTLLFQSPIAVPPPPPTATASRTQREQEEEALHTPSFAPSVMRTLEGATVRLQACVLVLEGLKDVLAGISSATDVHGHGGKKDRGPKAAAKKKDKKQQQDPAAVVAALGDAAARAVSMFLAVESRIDLENPLTFVQNRVTSRSSGRSNQSSGEEESVEEAEARVERLLFRSSVFGAYLLTDPVLVNRAPTRTAEERRGEEEEGEKGVSDDGNDDDVAMLLRQSDAVLASLLSNVGALTFVTVLETNARDGRVENDEDDVNAVGRGNREATGQSPELNNRDLALVAKAAASFASTTELMDGNEFYTQVLSPLNHLTLRHARRVTAAANEYLRTYTDGFGTAKRATTPRDFPLRFAAIRHLLDASRWLSKLTDQHFASADPAALASAWSAVVARRRVEEAVVRMLAVVPNALLGSENAAVLRWLAAVDIVMDSAAAAERGGDEENLPPPAGPTGTQSGYLLLCMRATALMPQDGVGLRAVKLELLGKLATMGGLFFGDPSSSASSAMPPNVSTDIKNWWAQSMRALLKSLESNMAASFVAPPQTQPVAPSSPSTSASSSSPSSFWDASTPATTNFTSSAALLDSATLHDRLSEAQQLVRASRALGGFMPSGMWRGLCALVLQVMAVPPPPPPLQNHGQQQEQQMEQQESAAVAALTAEVAAELLALVEQSEASDEEEERAAGEEGGQEARARRARRLRRRGRLAEIDTSSSLYTRLKEAFS